MRSFMHISQDQVCKEREGVTMVRSGALAFNVEAARKPTNLSLNESLLDLARQLKINISRACERGLQMQIAEVQAENWLEDNEAGIASSNEYFERHGLPLAKFRQF